MIQRFPTAAAMVRTLQPEMPVYGLRPHALEARAREFVTAFPGTTMYAVKCNAEPAVIQALAAGGVDNFDTASLAEIRLIAAERPGAAMHFMHPVKPPSAITAAWGTHGVATYSVDHPDELDKLIALLPADRGITLAVRMEVDRGLAALDLGGKFGAAPALAAELLRRIQAAGFRPGIAFHVGSQCLLPAAYTRALDRVRSLLADSGVRLGMLDVGGGFPVAYDGVQPPPLGDFMAAISAGIARLNLPTDCAIFSEPGRALVADGASLVVRVDLRRGQMLHINDGIFGGLFDLANPETRFPMRRVAMEGAPAPAVMGEFGFYGPTCDSADCLRGPFLLPADMKAGDYIEIGQCGAYTTALRTNFNGFFSDRFTLLDDAPLMPLAVAPQAMLKAV